MGAPHLQIVDGGDPDRCGAPTADGSPCENPPTSHGRCWIGAHRPDVDPDTEIPDPPAHLGEYGRSYWNYHVNRCAESSVLGIVDRTVVEKAAEVAQILRMCWDDIKENGPSVEDRNGGKKTNPSLAKYNSLMSDYRQLTKQIDGWVAQGESDGGDDGDGWEW